MSSFLEPIVIFVSKYMGILDILVNQILFNVIAGFIIKAFAVCGFILDTPLRVLKSCLKSQIN